MWEKEGSSWPAGHRLAEGLQQRFELLLQLLLLGLDRGDRIEQGIDGISPSVARMARLTAQGQLQQGQQASP